MASSNTKRKDKSEISENELYNTPLIALESFYTQFPEVFDQYDTYYDPCSGLGAISSFLKGLGKTVVTGDLIDYGYQDSVGDFLAISKLPKSLSSVSSCIVMNPPFTLTKEFVDHSLKLCDNVLMFNRMVTIESKYRANKFKSGEWDLDTMYQFGFRVSCTKGVDMEPTANSVAYSWFDIKRFKGTEGARLKWIT
jgi:hypothetical protein